MEKVYEIINGIVYQYDSVEMNTDVDSILKQYDENENETEIIFAKNLIYHCKKGNQEIKIIRLNNKIDISYGEEIKTIFVPDYIKVINIETDNNGKVKNQIEKFLFLNKKIKNINDDINIYFSYEAMKEEYDKKFIDAEMFDELFLLNEENLISIKLNDEKIKFKNFISILLNENKEKDDTLFEQLEKYFKNNSFKKRVITIKDLFDNNNLLDHDDKHFLINNSTRTLKSALINFLEDSNNRTKYKFEINI